MDPVSFHNWIKASRLSEVDVDCSTAVMLKILDGKCKMDEQEKVIMMMLYDQIKHRDGVIFGNEIHLLIEQARNMEDESMCDTIYEKRVLAESMISRPVMKRFKAMIREHGLFDL